MKILFITRKFPPSTGGMEQFAFDLSNALAAKTEISLVKWSGQGRGKAVVVALPYLFVRAFWRLLTGKIDVIHAQDGLLAPTGYILSRLFRKPYVVVIHGLDATYTNPLFQAIVPPAIRRANGVICISQAAAQAAKDIGVPVEKLQVIPVAVNDNLYGKSDRKTLINRLELPENTKFLLTVGRLVKRKGVAWFIANVLPDLVKQYPELVYLVIGDGPERVNVETAIKTRELGKHVRLLGRVTDDLYQAAYNGSDVFIMPNINVPGDIEGFGLVVLEASLCGLPVVAAQTEGITDAIKDGENGVLVPSEDASAFQEAIKHFLDSPAEAKKFGKHSREYTLRTYQWPALADRYLEIYKKLI